MWVNSQVRADITSSTEGTYKETVVFSENNINFVHDEEEEYCSYTKETMQ